MSTSFSKSTEIIGIIALVVSLLFVAYELQQSNRISIVAAYQTRIAEIQELNKELALSNELATILEKIDSKGIESLTPVEFRRARAWYSMILRGMQGQYYQYQQGFLERNVIDLTLEDIGGGIYDHWVSLKILDLIEIPEWRSEITEYLETTNDT